MIRAPSRASLPIWVTIMCLLVTHAKAQQEPNKSATPTRHGVTSAVAIFAGGCFWCMEHPFDELRGVLATTAGYTGGAKVNPTYEQVSAGGTGHAESVEVRYNPQIISYEKLLDVLRENPIRYKFYCVNCGRDRRLAQLWGPPAKTER